MRIAVVQHALRETPGEDLQAILTRASQAAARGADLIVIPGVPSLDAAELRMELESGLADVPVVVVDKGSGHEGRAEIVETLPFGRIGVVSRDACFDISTWQRLGAEGVDGIVLSPLSENDLQSEASVEVALLLSDSLAGLVVLADCAGAETGDGGHGGSAVLLLGEVVAEALGDDDLLIADIRVPVPQPEPREPLPEMPTILAQRLAHHAGRKPQVTYLADLSEGAPAL